ncbi:hypothetical protein DFH06DRAFT_1479633 [Mycena polygramma]|nr:hypothetical protein DFH06DRAFT_1479633 [Mycena polygramma]
MSANSGGLVCETCGGRKFQRSRVLSDTALTAELSEILRSNVSPQANMEASLRDVICRAPTELKRYDAEIGRLQDAISRLISERTALAAHLDACRSVFAPVRRLPIELLAEIFQMGVSSTKDDKPLFTTTPGQELDRLAKRSLLKLSQVSPLWHEVAIGTPRLWTTIVINTSQWRQPSSHRLLSLLRFSLEQSRDSPLKIRVCGKIEDPGLRFALELLSQHARRWQDVHFGINDGIQHLARAKGNLPFLKTVGYSTTLEDIDIFEVAPVLTEVIFYGRPQSIGKLPWRQINRFKYTGDRAMNPVAGLSIAKSLGMGAALILNLDLRYIDSHVEWPAVESNIGNLTLLLELGASSSDAKRCVGQLFQSFTAPHLRRLQLKPQKKNDTPLVWHHEQFLKFSLRSSLYTHLIALTLHAIITEEELLQCLSGLPLLEELTVASEDETRLDHILITDSLLERLTLHPDSPSLVPRLHLFDITSLVGLSDTAYWDFLSSRLDSGRNTDNEPFTVVIRCLTHGVGPDLLSRLSEMVLQQKLKFNYHI